MYSKWRYFFVANAPIVTFQFKPCGKALTSTSDFSDYLLAAVFYF